MRPSKTNPVKAAPLKPSQARRPLANVNAMVAVMHHNGKKASREGSSAFCQGPGASQHTSPVTAVARKKPAMPPASARVHISVVFPAVRQRSPAAPPPIMPNTPIPYIARCQFPSPRPIQSTPPMLPSAQGWILHAANGTATASGNAGMRHTLRPRKLRTIRWLRDWTTVPLPLITDTGSHGTRVAVITPPL